MLLTAIRYAKQQHHHMQMDWGGPYSRPLWTKAIVYGVARAWRLKSRAFNRWCDSLDKLYASQCGFEYSYTKNCGRDCWIDQYVEGESPQEAMDTDRQHWD